MSHTAPQATTANTMIVALPSATAVDQLVDVASQVIRRNGLTPGDPVKHLLAGPCRLVRLLTNFKVTMIALIILDLMFFVPNLGTRLGQILTALTTTTIITMIGYARWLTPRHREWLREQLDRIATRRHSFTKVNRLDAALMRHQARTAASATWTVWSQVVDGTAHARSWAQFKELVGTERGRNGSTWTIQSAAQAYKEQPRVTRCASTPPTPTGSPTCTTRTWRSCNRVTTTSAGSRACPPSQPPASSTPPATPMY